MNIGVASGGAAARRRRGLLGSTGIVWALASFAVGAGAIQSVPAMAQSAATVTNFSIPAQDLDGAVLAFGRSAGVRVFNDSEKLKGRRGNAVSGSMSAEDALARLLAGTGMHYAFTARGAVRIFELLPTAASTEENVELQEINVRGEGVGGSGETATGPVRGYVAKRSATATKTDTPLMETPRAVNVVTADEIAARGGAQNFSQALGYTPGYFALQNSDTRSNYFDKIRGFSTYGNLYLDGMGLPTGGTRSQPQTEIYGLERLEVLKGPASVLYGQSSPGGIVNMVSKRPSFDPIGEVYVQTGDPKRIQGAFDVSSAINGDDRFAYRLTGLAQKSDTHVDQVEDNRFFIAPAFTWKPDDDTSLTLLGQYRKNTGILSHNELPNKLMRDIPYGRYLGDPGADDAKTDHRSIGYEFNRRFNETFQVFSSARYFKANGDLRSTWLDGLVEKTEPGWRYGDIYRSVYLLKADITSVTTDNRMQADFETGPVRHKILFGVDYRRTRDFEDSTFSNSVKYNLIDLENSGTFSFPDPWNRNDRYLDQVGVYLQDQIKIDRFIVSLGGRHDWADTKVDSSFNEAPVKAKDSAFSGSAGLMYVFDNGLAPYASISTSFQPVADAGFDGSIFKPTTGTQYEAGLKYQVPGYNAVLTASVFDLRQQNVLTRDAEHENCSVYPDCGFFSKQTGEMRVRGLELEAKATLENLDLTASYAYLDSEITKSKDGNVGARFQEVPVHSGSLWANWRFTRGDLHGLNVGGGFRATGAFYGDTNDGMRNSPRVLVDAALGYDFGARNDKLKGVRLDLNVTNVGNKKYHTCSEWGCAWAEARTALATLRYKW